MTTTKLTNKQKKEWARMLYMREGMSFLDIAKKVDANRVTVSNWAKKEKWEMLRAATTTTKEVLIRNLYLQLAAIQDKINGRDDKVPTPAEADAILKISAAIAKMEGDLGIADIISVSKRFLAWVRDTRPERCQEMADMFDEFVRYNLR